jgi:hypothetical protein
VREEVAVPHPLLLPALALLFPAAPPPLAEQFRADPPTHVLRIVRVADGSPVRTESADGGEERAFAPGETARLLTALTGLGSGALDPDRRVPCDPTCWGAGSHGSPDLLAALATGCDTWFLRAADRVPAAAVAERAIALGFARAPAAEGGWAATAGDWTDFWRGLATGRTDVGPAEAATLLAAAGLCVSSPRGLARPLHDPRHGVRAVAGSAPGGAWVTGLVRRADDVDWAFALWVPDGSVPLAVARTSSLLEETLRRRENAAAERGAPLSPFDEDR